VHGLGLCRRVLTHSVACAGASCAKGDFHPALEVIAGQRGSGVRFSGLILVDRRQAMLLLHLAARVASCAAGSFANKVSRETFAYVRLDTKMPQRSAVLTVSYAERVYTP